MSELKPMKLKAVAVMGLAVIILLGLVITGLQLLNRQYAPVDPSDKVFMDVIIPENSNAGQIAAILKEHDLIRSSRVFINYCRKEGLDSQLKAGHYKFSRSQPLQDIVKAIADGKVVNISITIPEGYTIPQIGELLANRNICTREEWTRAIQKKYSYPFLEGVDVTSANYLEGFLFPNTYYITEDTRAEQIVKMMLEQFQILWNTEFSSLAEERAISVYDTLIIASMIEKEAMVADERRKISGVIKNRLERGMLLQIDATVLYCLEEDKDIVTLNDLEVDCPYNTYKYPGLPPGPIACPGKDSIQAALNPEEHSYYYYVSMGDGRHYFSRTYDEHLRAKQKYID